MLNSWNQPALSWITRGIALVFVAINAFGWWDESRARQDPGTLGEVPGDWFFQWAFFTHLLPLALILGATLLGWRWPFFGAIGFGFYAILQAISVGSEFAYLPYVVLPPLAISLQFLAGWLLTNRKSNYSQ